MSSSTRRQIWKSSAHPVVLLVAALALSALSLKAFPAPFVWIGLVWTAAFFAAIVCLSFATTMSAGYS